jgi:hypothetical protein
MLMALSAIATQSPAPGFPAELVFGIRVSQRNGNGQSKDEDRGTSFEVPGS